MPNSCTQCHGETVNILGFGLNPNVGDWSEDYDVNMATVLEQFFGPQGMWWQSDLETED